MPESSVHGTCWSLPQSGFGENGSRIRYREIDVKLREAVDVDESQEVVNQVARPREGSDDF